MPVVGWDVEAVTLVHVEGLDLGLLEEWVLLVVRPDELTRRVVVWISLRASVDETSVLWSDNREVFVTLVDAHHVLHCVGVRPGQGSKPVPVGDLLDVEESIHDWRQLQIFVKLTRWLRKTVVIVVSPILNLEIVEEFTIWHVDSLGSLSKVSESVVPLSFSPDDLVASSFSEVSLISPPVIGLLYLCIILENAWSALLDILVVEDLRSDLGVVTVQDILIVRHLKDVLSKVVVKVALAIDVLSNEAINHTASSEGFLVNEESR